MQSVPATVSLDPIAAAGLAVAGGICLIGPLLAGVWWRRRTGALLGIFGAGALVFFVSQVLLRLPWQVPLGRWVQAHPEWVIPFLLFSAFTAGLFEETGRWLGFRFLVRNERSCRTGVMFGLGHGALEAILLAGLPLLSLLVGWIAAAKGMVPQGPALEAIRQQTAAVGFWGVQLAALERASALAMHVGLALIVLQAWQRGGARWVVLAIVLHFGVNALGAMLIHGRRVSPLIAELVIAGVAIATLVTGWRLAGCNSGRVRSAPNHLQEA